MSYKIVSTKVFEKELKRLAKKYTSLKSKIAVFFEGLEAKPAQGTPLGNNCYKIRLAIVASKRVKVAAPG